MKTELDKLIKAAEGLEEKGPNVNPQQPLDKIPVVSLDKWHSRIKQVADAFEMSAINGLMELVSSPKTQKELDDSVKKGFVDFCINHLKVVIAMPETYGD